MNDSVAIWWVRRDLRLDDNPALQATLGSAREVVPLFIVDPGLAGEAEGSRRLGFLWQALRSLDAELRQRGSRLIVRRGSPQEILPAVQAETGAAGIYAHREYSPYATRRDGRLEKMLPLTWVGEPTLRTPWEVLKKDGTPYTVFTPYMRAWKEQPLPAWRAIHPAPELILTSTAWHSEAIPQLPYTDDDSFPPSEGAALQRLADFTGSGAAIFHYRQQRDLMAEEATSRLSPYLRFGLLSIRRAVLAALDAAQAAPQTEARSSAETWLNELIWREFYTSILYHFPHVLQRSFRPELQGVEWRNDERDFLAWQEGCTGYPVVDAAQRQLRSSGWMHNRARMISASFLVKNLLVNWQWGEKWFMQHLLDGDPASNNGGWQWTAGTGTDAAPYFRVFNPILQGKKFDPLGLYIRKWVPELQRVPLDYLHTPWEMPLDIQQACGCIIGKQYPAPVVDLVASRERVLQAYAAAKDRFRGVDEVKS